MIIGNNFIQTGSRSNDYNPLAHLPLSAEGKLLDHSAQAVGLPDEGHALNVHNELQKLNLTLDDYIVHLTAGNLAKYSFHIIVTPNAAQPKSQDLISPLAEGEELEIEPLDIKQNPERVAQAIQNQAFVALKKYVKEGKKRKVKIAPKFADLIEQGKIKQLKVTNLEGEVKEKIELQEAKITYFNAAEVDHISTVVFAAVGIAYQIRTLEQQQLQQQRKQDQQDIENREKRYREELLVERFQELLKSVEERHKDLLEEDDLAMQEAANCLTGSQNFIMQVILTETEEKQEQKAIEKQKQKKDKIIKDEIEKFELKKENIDRENKVRDIKHQAG